MDKQKSLPTVSKKITRKLAQESDKHNSLMNFYSSISRDETGAPKRWKMSSNLEINEDMITGGKVGTRKLSPATSRDNSGERRKPVGGKRNNRDGSSDSRDSSLETKGKGRGDSNERSKSVSQMNGSSGDGKSYEKMKGKRTRPRSLDLSSRAVNGDDDKFKSPDPLTPCNLIVKRRKGRPKETPPTLVAETSMDGSLKDSDSESEDDIDDVDAEEGPVKRPKGRPRGRGRGRGRTLVNRNLGRKSVKQTKFNMKRNSIRGGLTGRLPKLTKMKTALVTFSDSTVNSIAENYTTETNTSDQVNENVKTVKRGPGRPPGAKNKPKSNFGTKTKNIEVLRRKLQRIPLFKQTKLENKIRNGTSKKIVPKVKRKLSKTDSIEPYENMPEEIPETETDYNENEEVAGDEVESDCADELENSEEWMDVSMLSEGDPVDDIDGKSVELGIKGSKNLDDAIDSVVFKAGHNLPLNPPSIANQKRHGAIEEGRVKSLGKIRKEKIVENKVRKQKILKTHHKHIDCRTVDVLPSNDLRRKLHSKLLKRQALMKIQERLMKVCNPDGRNIDSVKKESDMQNIGVKKEVKSFKTGMFYPSSTGMEPKSEPCKTEPVSDQEGKVTSNIQLVPKVRKASMDMGDGRKFSDSESICSETSTVLSTNSFSSTKKIPEKHILVLGEDHVDSDDSSIRTRQRFEIVPGKSRKRTLSGEYDLLDEKQLRKERKLAGRAPYTDNADSSVERELEPPKKKSPLKRSPKVKLRNEQLKEKYGTLFKAKKAQLLRQSPFLTYKSSRRKKGIRKRIKTLSPNKVLNEKLLQEDSAMNTDGSYRVSPIKECSVTDGADRGRVGLFEKFGDLAGSSETKLLENKEQHPFGEILTFPNGETKLEPKAKIDESDPEAVVKDVLDKIIVEVVKQVEPESEVCDRLNEMIDKVVESVSDGRPNQNFETCLISVDETEQAVQEQAKFDVNSMFNPRGKGRKPGPGRGKKKFGPLPLARNNEVAKPFSGRGRGRGRGRSFMNRSENMETRRQKLTARKTSATVEADKGSPESGMTRKFELRQKISRSPLDNIALKQSLEENKYLKIEQQRAMKKEAKLKSKLKASNQDSTEDLQGDVVASDISESGVETSFEYQMDVDEEVLSSPEKAPTVEELLKRCRPCSVVLVDFIKKLNIGEDTETELESADSADDTRDSSPEAEVEHDSDQLENKHASVVNESEANEFSDIKMKVTPVLGHSEHSNSTEPAVDEGKPEDNIVPFKSDNDIKKEIDTEGDQTIQDQVEEMMVERSPKVKNTIESRTNKSVTKTPKMGPKSMISPKSDKAKKLFNVLTSPVGRPRKPEPQTARKTVPPLKIKVKGSTRRKTYIVEPSPNSPVTDEVESKAKLDKKKKPKSGNKSESDSEKHGKGHHHHKKRNKSPTDDIEQKPSSNSQAPELVSKPIKATDAYEANFLQFIQEKDKVEKNMQDYSSFYSVKQKHIPKVSKLQKTAAVSPTSAANTMTSSASSEAVTSREPPTTVANDQASSASQPVNDASEDVKYVCSQCENVEYKSEMLILQHYREVHPGANVMYKPLADTTEDALPATSAEQIVSTGLPGNQTETHDAANEDDDDDTGSLNLKIVDVVSLKDQENLLPEVPAPVTTQVPKPPVLPSTILNMVSLPSGVQLQPVGPVTELRIPHYPLPVSEAAHGAVNANAELYKHLLKNAPRPPIPQSAPIRQTQTMAKPAGKITETFKCESCQVHAPSLAAMVSHLKNGHKDISRLFQCPFCKEMEGLTEADIHQHIRKVHPTTDNPNPPVALSEAAKRNLKTLKVGLPENYKLGDSCMLEKDIYQCLKCKVHMPSLETIYDHLEQNHSEVFVFVCPFCKEFKSKTENAVCVHIMHVHRKSSADINISIAIDGTQFTRVQCLVKEKSERRKPHGNTKQPAPQQAVKQTLPAPVPTTVATAIPSVAAIQSPSQSQILQAMPHLLSSLTQPLKLPPQPANPLQAMTSQQVRLPISLSTFSQLPIPSSLLPSSFQQMTQIAHPGLNHIANMFPVQTSMVTSNAVASQPQAAPQTVPQTLTLNQLLPKHFQHMPTVSLPSYSSAVSAISTPPITTSTAASTPSPVPAKPPVKKKKNLLESIEQLKHQKQLEQQGLLPPKSSTSASVSLTSSAKAASSAPPPLMRAPPPLIRYDQLNKVSASSTVISTTVKMSTTSSIANIPSHINAHTLQRLQTLSTPRHSPQLTGITPKPIKSSLFDTSELNEPIKSPSSRPVLNVPVVPRASPSNMKPSEAAPGGVLDLSAKSTPTNSPVPSPRPPSNTQKDVVNPDLFNVFNLKPSTQLQLQQRVVAPQTKGMLNQPVFIPQVRQNTPSTLAYRPPPGQVIANSQIPQIINMPLIGNVVVSLPQGMTGVPQLVKMSAPMPVAGLVPVSNTSQAVPIGSSPQAIPIMSAPQAIPIVGGPQPLPLSMNMMFRCPYCPKVVPLNLAQVQPHIEGQHPGHSILFTPLDQGKQNA